MRGSYMWSWHLDGVSMLSYREFLSHSLLPFLLSFCPPNTHIHIQTKAADTIFFSAQNEKSHSNFFFHFIFHLYLHAYSGSFATNVTLSRFSLPRSLSLLIICWFFFFFGELWVGKEVNMLDEMAQHAIVSNV